MECPALRRASPSAAGRWLRGARSLRAAELRRAALGLALVCTSALGAPGPCGAPAAPRAPLRALAAALGPAAPPAAAAARAAGLGAGTPESPAKALRRLEGWAQGAPALLEQVDGARAEQAVRDALGADPASGERVDLALLALCGRELALPPEGNLRRSPERLAAWRGGLSARLSGRFGAGTLVLLADRVLLMPGSFSEEQRLAALDLFTRRPEERASLALAFLASDPRATSAERRAAIEALVACPGPAALEGLLRAIESGPAEGQATARAGLVRRLEGPAAAELHDAGPGLAERLAHGSLAALLDPDWRVAAGAAELCGHLLPAQAVPALIEALRHWHARWTGPEGERQVGAGRVAWALCRSLRRLTGRWIGPDPEGWSRMLEAVEQGAPLTAPAGDTSASSFFGLSLETGHVAFLVDRSGSMSAPAPATAHPEHRTDSASDRLSAASAELLRALERGGDRLWFQLALFSDEGRLWRAGPTRADAEGIEAARRFLREQRPDGGTQLSSGIEAWLRGDGAQSPGPAADTLVILCDGETLEDAAWAEACLRDPRMAGVRVHAVQIGGASAEALATLCARTGGQLVRL